MHNLMKVTFTFKNVLTINPKIHYHRCVADRKLLAKWKSKGNDL